jgi:hypothetical protein
MLIVHGIYRWWPKRLAFRNDYCLRCGGPRRSVQIRTFDVWHIFWIPILPLGFWKRWFCTTCGRQPHASRKTRRPFKWAGLFVLLFFAAVSWAVPLTPDVAVWMWVVRLGSPVAAAALLIHLLKTKKDPSMKERLEGIPRATDTVCPFCGSQLLTLASSCSCPVCGVARV